MLFQINQNGAVGLSSLVRPIVQPQHAYEPGDGRCASSQATQERGRAHRHPIGMKLRNAEFLLGKAISPSRSAAKRDGPKTACLLLVTCSRLVCSCPGQDQLTQTHAPEQATVGPDRSRAGT